MGHRSFSLKQKFALWRRQDYRCGICNGMIYPSQVSDYELINVDHIRPRSHGGGHNSENLQLTHVRCNTEKADVCAGCPVCTLTHRIPEDVVRLLKEKIA
jgi:hypothetical protein